MLQTDGWLAELRDDGRADPPGDGHAGRRRQRRPRPEALAEPADALRRGRCPRPGCRPLPTLTPALRPLPAPRPAARAEAAARAERRRLPPAPRPLPALR